MMGELPDYKNKTFEKGYLGKFDDKAVGYDLFFDEQSKIKAKFKDGHIEDFDGHRIQVDISIKSYNYLKQSWLSGDEIRKGGSCVIKLNNFQVYEFFFRKPENALLEARNIVLKLYEFAIQVWRPEEREGLKGRKVFYHQTPCHVKYFSWDQGCVILETDDGKPFPRPVWDTDRIEDCESTIKDDYLSPHIWWYRK